MVIYQRDATFTGAWYILIIDRLSPHEVWRHAYTHACPDNDHYQRPTCIVCDLTVLIAQFLQCFI